jgi:hypothetical protein
LISKSKVALELPGISVSGDAAYGCRREKPRSSGLIALRGDRLERYNSGPENRLVVNA